MSEYNNSMDIMDDGMTFETPAHAGRTLKRLWRFVNDQHKRLTIVLVSVVFYTFLSLRQPIARISSICFGTASRPLSRMVPRFA